MPWSSNTFEDIFAQHLALLRPNTVLDVGAGAGKYGKIIKEILPEATVSAIEPTEQYINEYRLQDIYSKVYMQNVHQFIENHSKERHDLVVFGDVLEHFFRSQVIDILDYFLYRNKWVLIIWPTHLPQDDALDNNYEIHRSNFNLNDLTGKFNVYYYLKNFGHYHIESCHPSEFNYCLIKGHMLGFHESLYKLPNWK